MGISLLVGSDGIAGMAIAGMDHAFNCVELPSELLLAFPGEMKKQAVFGKVFLRESPEMTHVELNLRVRLDAAEARTMASCAEM